VSDENIPTTKPDVSPIACISDGDLSAWVHDGDGKNLLTPTEILHATEVCEDCRSKVAILFGTLPKRSLHQLRISYIVDGGRHHKQDKHALDKYTVNP